MTFDPLTLKVRGTSGVMWSRSVRNLNEIQRSSVQLLIILQISAHVMSGVTCRYTHRPLNILGTPAGTCRYCNI